MSHRKLQPIGDYILVQENKTEEAGKLIIPDSAKTPFVDGHVVAVGEECKHVKKGDTIYFDISRTTILDFDKQKYALMREAAIFGIIRTEQ